MLRQIAVPLATALAIGLTVLLAERLVQLLDITLGKRNSFSVIFQLMAYWMPHYVGLAAPVALYLGLLFGFNKMSKDAELDAMMAAGVGLGRLTRPVIALAAVLSLNAVLMFGWVQPYTLYAYRSMIFTLSNVDVFYLAEEGVFMQSGARTFVLDKLSRGDYAFERIFVFENRGKGGSETITANRGALVERPGETRPVLQLEDGHRLKIDGVPDYTGPAPLPQAEVGDFANADTPLGRLSARVFRGRGENERELTLIELYQRWDDPPSRTTADRMKAEFHLRIAMGALVMVLPFLALPFALGRRRGNRAYRFGVALVLLVAFHEILQQGSLWTKVHGISPALTIWLPFSLFTAFALWRFYVTCYTLHREWLEPAIEAVADSVAAVGRRLTPGRMRTS